MNILVTGGAGYIGSHTVKLLKQAGHEVYVFDSLENGHKEYILPLVGEDHFIKGDIRVSDDLDRLFSQYQFSAVMHFAAYAEAGESVKEPDKYFVNNVTGTQNLLSAMLERSVTHIIFSSTAAVYGVPTTIPIQEEAAKKPINPYGESKLQAEQAIMQAAETDGLQATILRYFNAAGADPDGELGERHEPESHLIANLLKAAAGRLEACEIYGSDYPTPDGTTVRDYVHVSDIASAHVQALEAQDKEPTKVAIYNIGTNHGYSIKEVIAMCEKVVGRPIPVTMKDRRPGDPPVLVADASKIQKKLAWYPKYSDLKTIIQTAWAWQQRQS